MMALSLWGEGGEPLPFTEVKAEARCCSPVLSLKYPGATNGACTMDGMIGDVLMVGGNVSSRDGTVTRFGWAVAVVLQRTRKREAGPRADGEGQWAFKTSGGGRWFVCLGRRAEC